MLIKQLTKRFKQIPDEYIEQIKKLSPIALDEIGEDIFDFERIEDLERYF